MNTMCETVLDLLPDLAACRLSAADELRVRGHLKDCPECAQVLETLSALTGEPLEVPAGLETRIQAAVTHEFAGASAGSVPGASGPAADHSVQPLHHSRRFAQLRNWGWAAAAVLALVVGRDVFTQSGPGMGGTGGISDSITAETGVELVALGEFAGPAVFEDDQSVAGAPDLAGLSEDDLRMLLEEWEG